GTDLEVKKSGTWPSLTAGASGGGPFDDYAYIADRKTSGLSSGTSPGAPAWNQRVLNTIVKNDGSIVTLSANQFTLQAGSYYIKASAPGYSVGQHMIRLINITDANAVVAAGTSEYCYNSDNQTRSFLTATITIGSAKTYKIEHWLQEINITNGFGQPTNQGQSETYAKVEIWKKD
ncbi:hypothetical protein MJH12_13750, partial [bacterium]|nr:hypothetical protein [bacterium]